MWLAKKIAATSRGNYQPLNAINIRVECKKSSDNDRYQMKGSRAPMLQPQSPPIYHDLHVFPNLVPQGNIWSLTMCAPVNAHTSTLNNSCNRLVAARAIVSPK